MTYLRHVKGRGRSIKTDIVNDIDPNMQYNLTDKELRELLIRIKDHNDQEAKDFLCRYHVKMVISICTRYNSLVPNKHLGEDLIDVGLLAMVKAIEKAIKDKDISTLQVEGYIAAWVHGYVGKFVMKENKEHDPIILYTIGSNHTYVRDTKIQRLELEEIIQKVSYDERDKIIFKLKYLGYTSLEIGQRLNLSKQFINQTWRRIKNRVIRLLE